MAYAYFLALILHMLFILLIEKARHFNIAGDFTAIKKNPPQGMRGRAWQNLRRGIPMRDWFDRPATDQSPIHRPSLRSLTIAREACLKAFHISQQNINLIRGYFVVRFGVSFRMS